MLYRIERALFCEDKLDYQMASLFHGSLMEILSADYADYLHQSQFHPYSQHLERRNDQWFWILNALDDTAYEEFQRAFRNRTQIELRKHGLTVGLGDVNLRQTSGSELRETFYRGGSEGFFHIRFLTPASFKRRGEYLIYPDLFCIFQNLMNKYDAVNESGFMDPDALEELTIHSRIIRYRLSSTFFSLEGTRIPSFIGTITVKMDGTSTMKRFAQMLLQFGEYSGIGIKTALGMGAISLEKQHRV